MSEAKEFDEGSIRFKFGERWVICKLDDHPAYRTGIGTLNGTKAVDFVGVLDKTETAFVEVKDFRGHRIENVSRIRDGELWLEVGRKVRDSLAVIVSARRRSSVNAELWEDLSAALADPSKDLKIILWIEEDLTGYSGAQSGKDRLSVYTKKLKQKLSWLTTHVIVCNTATNPLDDLEIENLPRVS